MDADDDDPTLQGLTEKQREMLRLVLQHMGSKQIARVMGVSPHTVDAYMRTAARRLGVSSRVEAARVLAQHELDTGAHQPLTYQRLAVADEDQAGFPSPGGDPHGSDRTTRSPSPLSTELGRTTNHSRGRSDFGFAASDGSPPHRWLTTAVSVFDAWREIAGDSGHNTGSDRSATGRPWYVSVKLARLGLIVGSALGLSVLVGGSFVAIVVLVTSLQFALHAAH